jgi:hypothetical protein
MQMNPKRPVGMICLVAGSFAFCVVFVLGGVDSLRELIRSLRHIPGAPEYYSLGYVLMFLASVCCFFAAWIAATTGIDLWKFRRRGRMLALTATLFFFLFAVFLFRDAFWTGVIIAICSVAIALYFQLPRIRAAFQSEPSDQGGFLI